MSMTSTSRWAQLQGCGLGMSLLRADFLFAGPVPGTCHVSILEGYHSPDPRSLTVMPNYVNEGFQLVAVFFVFLLPNPT